MKKLLENQVIKQQRTSINYLIIIFNVIFICIFSCNSRDYQLKKQGNVIIKKIENYRLINHKLPNGLKDIGIEETLEGPIYYNKIDSTKYIIWYGTTLGESIIYNSETKKWE